MKNFNKIFYLLTLTIVFSSCASLKTTTTTIYEMQSEGENFDALSKITDLPNPCIAPFGGDSSKNLVFHSKDENGFYQIFFKENVLMPAVIKKTFGDANNAWGRLSPSKQKLVYQSSSVGNSTSILYLETFKGRAITQVLSTSENYYSPSFSPDGKSILVEKGAHPRSFTFGSTTHTTNAPTIDGNKKGNNKGVKILVGCLTGTLLGILMLPILYFY